MRRPDCRLEHRRPDARTRRAARAGSRPGRQSRVGRRSGGRGGRPRVGPKRRHSRRGPREGSARLKVLAMAGQTKVKLLTDHDLPYTDLVPGLELSRAITHAGTTQLGGGYMRFSADAEFPDWTLKYDEVLFVQSGELEIVSDGASVKASVGQAILSPNGARVTYRGRKGTGRFLLLWPFAWEW